MNEREAIEILSGELGSGPTKGSPGWFSVLVGIGDDTAVLSTPARGGRVLSGAPNLVWTIDHSEEGQHFDRRWLSLPEISRRAFHAAVSDVAAMAAKPLAALCHLTLPADISKGQLRKIARGQATAQSELSCPLIGGNLGRGTRFTLTTTVLGVAEKPLLRSGARPGDELWLMGNIGLARAGLELLRRDPAQSRRGHLGACVGAWRRPQALIKQGLSLSGRATACVDLSDGLGGDARHIAEQSGVRVVIHEPLLGAALSPALLAAAGALEVCPQRLALTGGEDYALLATGKPGRRPRGARLLGEVVKGAGVSVRDANGKESAPPPGFDHLGEC